MATAAADSSVTASTTITVQATDPLGTTSFSRLTCPTFSAGTSGAACYEVHISCPGVADFSAYVKVNQPSASPIGTVILGTGEGGSGLYDDSADFIAAEGTNGGLMVVNDLLDANYTTAQVSFGAPFNTNTPNGWLTGPGGVRRLACRYATLAQWIQTNVPPPTKIPLCATGNSGGAGAIGYALMEYGLDSIFTMVESTSGPPMSRLDQACVQPSACQSTAFTCNPGDQPENIHMCYSASELQIIDPAYSQPLCTNALNGTVPPDGLLLSDSILGGPTRTFSPTYVNVVVGGQDTRSAVDQALTWESELCERRAACSALSPGWRAAHCRRHRKCLPVGEESLLHFPHPLCKNFHP